MEQKQYLRRFSIVMVIDGTEKEVVTSTTKKKTTITYSGKKNYHTFTKLIGVGLNGHIWYVSPSYGEHLNDLNLVDFPEIFIHKKF